MEPKVDKCNLCNVIVENDSHKGSDLHRFNFLLFEWNNYRKSLVKNRNGVVITQKLKHSSIPSESCYFEERKGSYVIQITSSQYQTLEDVVTMQFTLENERKKDNIRLVSANILHPFYDRENIVENNSILEFEPKQKFILMVTFKLERATVGKYEVPLAFSFQTVEEHVQCFTIIRQVLVIISDFVDKEEKSEKSPFKSGMWGNIEIVIPPMQQPFATNLYPIPNKYKNVLMSGIQEHKYFNNDDNHVLNYVRNVLDRDFHVTRRFEAKYPTVENYRDFYHFLVWLDEIGQSLMLQRYNMSCVTMSVVNNNQLELEVPGLAEKRPSLLNGDLVKIRVHEDHTVYRGVVSKINDKTIIINSVVDELISYIQEYNDIELDVAFELGRLPYERMHKGIDNCVDKGMLKTLFPESSLANRNLGKNYTISRFFNPSISNNVEQKTAVLNILNCTSQYAPYIVFGPPGTGKTITIVEAILQIKENVPGSKILVCAPANAACDMLTSKLLLYCNKQELIRVHTETRDWKTVPEPIKPFSNHMGGKYIRMTGRDLHKFRIVVTTLVLIGKYCDHYCPDYVFIDEAAQAMEPEVDIAIGLMKPGKQLILAGDPKQLGPQCASKVAAELKLEVSLLERLMITNELYINGNSNFITMLKLNYRAHSTVLQVPNELFYDGKLQAVNMNSKMDPIASTFIYPLTTTQKRNTRGQGQPVEFCAVYAKEQRQGKSPSYYNESEIQMVVKYINALLSLTNIKVAETDIGIVTPYIRQVHRLKTRLESCQHADIEVGTTEVFQGREKRIMILSTVRGQQSLLLYDKKYKLGFVSNEKRMNVALTRAMSKLIVIGNPLVLGTDNNWLRYIEFCEGKRAYFGPKYARRTDDVKIEIQRRLNFVNMKDLINQENGGNSNNKGNKNRRK